jgi:hypothetical protein
MYNTGVEAKPLPAAAIILKPWIEAMVRQRTVRRALNRVDGPLFRIRLMGKR